MEPTTNSASPFLLGYHHRRIMHTLNLSSLKQSLWLTFLCVSNINILESLEVWVDSSIQISEDGHVMCEQRQSIKTIRIEDKGS